MLFILALSGMSSAAQIAALASYPDDTKVSQKIQIPSDVVHLQYELNSND